MKRLTTSLAALALLVSGAANADDLGRTLERNKQLVERMVAAINQRDLDALDDLVAPDLERHCAATPEVEVHDREQFKAFLRQDLTAVPDSVQVLEQLVAEGDMVAVRARYVGTQSGPMGPFPPSGRRLEIPFLGFLRVADGRIAEIWVEWDNLGPLVQLGHLAPPGAESANKALARRWFEDVINRRDLEAIADIYAADYVHHGPEGREMRGLDTVREFAAAILAASQDRHAVVETQVAEGDTVVTRFTSRGTRTGPFRGAPASGREWTTEGIVISRIEGGKIIEDWEIVHSSEE